MTERRVTTDMKVVKWEESPYETWDGGKLTRAHVTYGYQGELDGEGAVEYLMAYHGEQSATFVGVERFTGRLAGREGTCVMRHVGASRPDGTVLDERQVVEGTGTGAFAGVRGTMRFESGHAEHYPLEFAYDHA
jgi:hypothetical protein